MPRRNLTACNHQYLNEAADQIAALSKRVSGVASGLSAAKLKTIDCPHCSNFAEALRRLHFFVGGAEESLAAARLKSRQD